PGKKFARPLPGEPRRRRRQHQAGTFPYGERDRRPVPLLKGGDAADRAGATPRARARPFPRFLALLFAGAQTLLGTVRRARRLVAPPRSLFRLRPKFLPRESRWRSPRRGGLRSGARPKESRGRARLCALAG